MLFKALAVVLLAVGVLGEYQITDDQRQMFKDYVKKACESNNAPDKVEQVETAARNFMDCVKGLFDAETVKKEIEEAKPNGALDEVFKKYCAKSPQLKTCISNMAEGISPCLDPSIREHIGAGKSATNQLIDFVCYKDGDRIALFIAEEGPECFKEKSGALRTCVNKLREEIKSVEEAKKLTLEQKCGKFDEMTQCVVKALEECSSPTPGNMAESLFKYVRNESPCKKN
ncbi:27 kDa hemolymph protein-like [Leptidea sinapis]|uniref:Uncharacterized protein n=1 Tax=Leptidea sinapis TaxID=189913 RepID=A0A5E4PTH1_9NEOP|nr:27 kDa hemolymph protein-like [Leptidea sinapis]VVC89357.1 unnamed protein product [Leptidea sinapis]